MNLRKLYEHLDTDARRILHATAETAARDGRSSISIELFLVSLLRDRGVGPVVMKALDDAGGHAPAIESTLAAQVAQEPRSPSGALPSFDESLAQLLREAWSLAFDEYGETSVTPVRFFETVARRGDRWPRLVAQLPGFDRIDPARLAVAGSDGAARDAIPDTAATDPQFQELSRYGADMIAAARDPGFDPVVGFRTPMQAISSILLRRRQNSAIVVGEAGVGKTACALGFIDALARETDAVPQAPVRHPGLVARRVRPAAGAVVRGALEERLQAIVKEIEQAGMILFIDDIHLLFGDQSQGADALRSILNAGDGADSGHLRMARVAALHRAGPGPRPARRAGAHSGARSPGGAADHRRRLPRPRRPSHRHLRRERARRRGAALPPLHRGPTASGQGDRGAGLGLRPRADARREDGARRRAGTARGDEWRGEWRGGPGCHSGCDPRWRRTMSRRSSRI